MVAPTLHLLRLLTALMRKLATPAIELDGPMCVTMNCRQQVDGRWAVHLHKAPGSSHRYAAPPASNYLHSPGEVLPVYGLTLRVAGRKILSACSGISGKAFEITEDGRAVGVPRLDLHDVVLLAVGES